MPDKTTRLRAFALNCSLRGASASEPSSTQKLLKDLLATLKPHGVTGKIERAVDHDIKPGVKSFEGKDDAWPKLRRQILQADIFILGTPIWLGQPSSVAKRVMERMDAFLDETDNRGRMPAFGKVAIVAVVGNEDGAHHVHAECYQALNDVGFTIPANGGTYWVGEAMGDTNYVDLKKIPEDVDKANTMLAANAAHLARLLKLNAYPGIEAE